MFWCIEVIFLLFNYLFVEKYILNIVSKGVCLIDYMEVGIGYKFLV